MGGCRFVGGGVFPRGAWECVIARIRFASMTLRLMPDSLRGLRFAKRRLARRIPKRRLGSGKGGPDIVVSRLRARPPLG